MVVVNDDCDEDGGEVEMKKFDFKGLACIDSELSRLCMEQIARLPEMVGEMDIIERLFAFDDDPIITSYDYADKVLDELGTFNCVNLVLAYGKQNFGYKVDRLDAPLVANICVRIFGRELLYMSAYYREEPCRVYYTKRDLQKIEAELQVYLESLTEDFSNVVFDEYGV